MSRITQSEIEIIASGAFEDGVAYALVGRDSGQSEESALSAAVGCVRYELEKAGVRTQQKRSAIVSRFDEDGAALRTVQNYLPANFEARYFEDATLGTVVLIEGYDRAGWTLDTYVIPRLASGLIVAKEVK
jgi:hypothetical protein